MFRDAIEEVSKFTRPIHSISRTYNQTDVVPGTATLFFVNKDGWAVTCKHVLNQIIAVQKLNKNYTAFKKEIDSISTSNKNKKEERKKIEQKYGYNDKSTVQLKNNFRNCVDNLTGFKCHAHKTRDLALIKFQGFKNLLIKHFPTFGNADDLKQGDYLCRLGYPFPEFNNYKYNLAKDDIEWTKKGKSGSPKFPIEGMVTRFIGKPRNIYGIELSRPGLKGQSGGPLFNKRGEVVGMQASTKHLHLGFDIEEKEIRSNGESKKVSDYSFLHLGVCMHGSVIKKFMEKHDISFETVE